MDDLIAYWPFALIAAIVAVLLLYLLLRPRQRVALTDSAPVRPHMAVQAKTADEAVGHSNHAAAANPADAAPLAQVHNSHPGASGAPDDLLQLKGVGPKLAALLISHGLTRFDQLATLSPSQVDSLDDTLGAFRGRLARDRVVDQADYLARGDIDGFDQRFGKI